MFNSDGAPLLHTPRKLAPSLSRPAIERAAGEALQEFEQVGDGLDRGLCMRARRAGRKFDLQTSSGENQTWAS